MRTLISLFLFALVFSLLLTPVVAWLGRRLGAVDVPAERNVHLAATPRIGGVSVFLSFVITISLTNLYLTDVSKLFAFDHRTAFGLYGALVVFGCGLWDDFRRLNPWIKLLCQIVGASIAFAGGISIGGIFIDWTGFEFGIFSYAATVFWFLLFINAVNLIDGLDGLAGGVVLFTCLMMVVLSLIVGNYLNALYFIALGGAVLGFLCYNFNPASIFLGDSGSYFLGYAVAALSIIGSVKSQVGVLMLIPVLALGVPIFDTILSPLRRWIKGSKIFAPDREHIHHRLLARGLSTRRVVLLLYGVTLILCIAAITIINLRNHEIGILLIFIGVTAIILMRKTGYLGYIAFDKLYGWFRDMSDVAGFTEVRRTFLSVQMQIGRSRSPEELFENLGLALNMLKFDRAELHLKKGRSKAMNFLPADTFDESVRRQPPNNGEQQHTSTGSFQNIWDMEKETVWVWSRSANGHGWNDSKEGILKIDLPLNDNGIEARIILMKDLNAYPLDFYTLRRIEQLRRTLLSSLARLK